MTPSDRDLMALAFEYGNDAYYEADQLASPDLTVIERVEGYDLSTIKYTLEAGDIDRLITVVVQTPSGEHWQGSCVWSSWGDNVIKQSFRRVERRLITREEWTPC